MTIKPLCAGGYWPALSMTALGRGDSYCPDIVGQIAHAVLVSARRRAQRSFRAGKPIEPAGGEQYLQAGTESNWQTPYAEKTTPLQTAVLCSQARTPESSTV